MRNSYHTQQRCALLAFLSAHADEQFTVEQLLAAMGDEAPGRSTTIYGTCAACGRKRDGHA